MRRIVFTLAGVTFHALAAFTFNDIHYWVGEGENVAGVAICWEGVAKAWGVRWSGLASVKDVISAVVAEDGRLCADVSLSTFSYDDVRGADVRIAGSGFTFLAAAASSAFPVTSAFSSVSLAEAIQPGGWLMVRAPSVGASAEPTAAETPYGWRVIDSATDATASYRDPSVVLGPPTRTMTVPSVGLPPGAAGETSGTYVITPAYPAWLAGRLFSLVTDLGKDEADSFVTIEFDHDVIDDPDNPFGIDFIVFCNSMCSKWNDKSSIVPTTDPASFRLSGVSDMEGFVVEVAQSADGPWFGKEEWGMSNGFAPTLGHRYDPDNVDTNLYSGNLWWGAPTDPTYPVDPHIDFPNCAGLTLAELCQRYNGSAGGRGFDLEEINIPTNIFKHGGRKWFRYVRISNADAADEEGDTLPTDPDVDAVADVAPVSGYKNWVLDNFTWDKAWQTNLTAATVIAPNGLPNGLNCVYGLKPTDIVANVPFEVVAFEQGETEHVIQMRSPTRLTATPKGLVVKKAAALNGEWTAVPPTLVSAQQDGNVWLNTFTVPKDDAMFFKLSLDE